MADLGPHTENSIAGTFFSSAIAACFAEVTSFTISGSNIFQSSLFDPILEILLNSNLIYFPVPIADRVILFMNTSLAVSVLVVVTGLRTALLYYRKSKMDAFQFCTLPLDTAKVRLQLQKKAAAGEDDALPYRGMLGTMVTIAREEGLSALWKGIVPGLHRQFLYGGLRIGLYEPFKLFFAGSLLFGDVPLIQKILAALATGAIAILVANPTDLVKVRLQAEGKLLPGVPKRYSGALDAYLTIIRQDGLWALWTGLGPNIARNAIINAAELASYDHIKETILALPGFTDNFLTHMVAGLGAGLFAVCIGSPVDVVKSRMMGDSTYKSTVDCFVKTLKSEGPLAFYKGFLPNFGRLGSWNVIMFLTLEKVKMIFQRQI